MMHEPQPNAPSPWKDPAATEPCAGCGAEVHADPVDGGLNCARCGQWQALCDDCMPNVTEFSRDAAWLCPECRERPLDS